MSLGPDAPQLVDEVFDGQRLIGHDLDDATLLDCRFVDCDLSAAHFQKASLHRVEFVRCRLSAANFGAAELEDARFLECKLDDANFRMATGKRATFEDTVLIGADFYAASMPGTRRSSSSASAAAPWVSGPELSPG